MQSCAFGHSQVLSRSHSSFARRPLRLASRCSKSSGVWCAAGDVMLEVKGLEARVASTGEHILRGVNLTVREGEIHAIMGTNGSGKSTFSKVLVGHPDYEVTGGTGTMCTTSGSVHAVAHLLTPAIRFPALTPVILFDKAHSVSAWSPLAFKPVTHPATCQCSNIQRAKLTRA